MIIGELAFLDSNVIICVCTEIEMVVMEKFKVSELTEQNITDEEKTAAATRSHTQRSRFERLFGPRK